MFRLETAVRGHGSTWKRASGSLGGVRRKWAFAVSLIPCDLLSFREPGSRLRKAQMTGHNKPEGRSAFGRPKKKWRVTLRLRSGQASDEKGKNSTHRTRRTAEFTEKPTSKNRSAVPHLGGEIWVLCRTYGARLATQALRPGLSLSCLRH